MRKKFIILVLMILTLLMPMHAAMAVTPSVIAGHNSCFIKGQQKDLAFTVKDVGASASLGVASVAPRDGQAAVTITPADYTLSGMRVVLKRAFLEALTPGRYTLNLLSANGSFSADFYYFLKATIFFITQPKAILVNGVGDDASFSVEVTGAADGVYTYQWQRRSHSSATGWKNVRDTTSRAGHITGSQGRTLTIENLPEELTGYVFRCKVTRDGGGGTAYSDNAKLHIMGAGDSFHPWQWAIVAGVALMAVIACWAIWSANGKKGQRNPKLVA